MPETLARVSISLVVSGVSCDPELVTATLCVEPSSVTRLGERRGEHGLYRNNVWRLKSIEVSIDQLNSVWIAFSANLSDITSDRLAQIGNCRVELKLIVVATVDNIALQVPTGVLEFCARTGIRLFVQMYMDEIEERH